MPELTYLSEWESLTRTQPLERYGDWLWDIGSLETLSLQFVPHQFGERYRQETKFDVKWIKEVYYQGKVPYPALS